MVVSDCGESGDCLLAVRNTSLGGPRPPDGFIVMTDITGYTTFLNESELDYARESLGAILSGPGTRIRGRIFLSADMKPYGRNTSWW